MIKQTLVGLLAAGSVAYAAEDPALTLHEEPTQLVISSISTEPMESVPSHSTSHKKTTHHAKAFASRVHEFTGLVASGTVEGEQVIIHRSRIRSSFELAFEAIEAEEKGTPTSATEPARELMQEAIGEYMSGNWTSKSPEVTRDLEAYSRFLTETLIAQAVKNSESNY